MEQKWIIDINPKEEEWNDEIEFITREDAIREGNKFSIDKGVQIFSIGQKDNINFEEFLDTDLIIENIMDDINWEFGEAETYCLEELEEEKKEELDKMLKKTLKKWLDKNNIKPNFYNIKNVEIIEVSEEY